MTDAASLLSRMIVMVEDALRARRIFETDAAARDFLALVRAEVAKPCDGERLLDVHVVLAAEVLEHIDRRLRAYDNNGAALWQQLAGVLLPELRADLGRAIKFRRGSA